MDACWACGSYLPPSRALQFWRRVRATRFLQDAEPLLSATS